MRRCALLLFLLVVPAMLHADDRRPEATVQKKFVSGGTIRLHLEAGGYTITPSDSDNIVITYHANSESRLREVKVDIEPSASSAEVYITDTPSNKFEATIEVPRHSNLWVRLTAGELDVEAVEGDKNLELRAGELQVEIPHPEEYGHRDASVTMGSLESDAFDVSKGGMFRSFDQQGPGKYRLHAHVLTGDINLRGSN
jgi:hypothetical protein